MRGEVPTIRPIVPTPRGDAEWFAQMIGKPRPAVRRANRQSSICNHQSEAVYEYDVYGQPAASDPNHPNRFMFTGRRFDPETGLYYYRARYYNPAIGRFLQTDPIGYGDGMNMYAYCGNSPISLTDPSGCHSLSSNYGWALYHAGNIEGDGAWIWVEADIAGLAQWTNYPVWAIQTTTHVINGQVVLVYSVPAATQYLGPNQSNPVGRFGGTMSVLYEDGMMVTPPDGLAVAAVPDGWPTLPPPDLGGPIGDAVGIAGGVVGSSKLVPVVGEVSTVVSVGEAALRGADMVMRGKIAEAKTRQNARMLRDSYYVPAADPNDEAFYPGFARIGSRRNGRQQGPRAPWIGFKPFKPQTPRSPVEELLEEAGY